METRGRLELVFDVLRVVYKSVGDDDLFKQIVTDAKRVVVNNNLRSGNDATPKSKEIIEARFNEIAKQEFTTISDL